MTLIANKLIEVKPMSLPSGVYHHFDAFGSFGDIRVKNLSDYSLNFQKKLMQDLFNTAFVDDPNPFDHWVPDRPFKIYRDSYEDDNEHKIMPG